jgi:hypothetical protein
MKTPVQKIVSGLFLGGIVIFMIVYALLPK